MMDHLVGPILQTVLDVKEGKGFAFLTNPLIVVAALNGNKLESSEIRPSPRPTFDTQLLWQSEKKYLKRLRTGNTALKIECYVVINEKKRDRLGYILLNLKEAQIIPRKSGIAILETWHRLLGLRSEAKNHNPELLISFKIEEGNDSDEASNDKESHQAEEGPPGGPKADAGNHLNSTETPELTKDLIQIGPPELCKDCYELTVSILEILNMYSMITPSEVGLPITMQYSLMGRTFITGNLAGAPDGFINFHSSFELKSTAKFLSAYFQEFPTLVFNVLCGGQIIGSASLDLKDFTKLEEIKIHSFKSKILIKKWNQSESNSSESHVPYLQVTVNLSPKNNLNIYVGDMPTNSLATPKMIGVRKQSSTQLKNPKFRIPVKTPPHQPLDFPESMTFQTPSLETGFKRNMPLEPQIQENLESDPTREPKDVGIQVNTIEEAMFETIGTNGPTPRLTLETPDLLPRQYIREAAIKTCEELEDWKDQQEELFKFELKRKAERHLKKLTFEWNKRKRNLESSLQERIDACQSIFHRLGDACDEIKKQSDVISITQKELQDTKKQLNDGYSNKFEELRRASLMHKKDMNKTLNSLLKENVRLKTKLDHKELELAELIRALNRKNGNCRWCSRKNSR